GLYTRSLHDALPICAHEIVVAREVFDEVRGVDDAVDSREPRGRRRVREAPDELRDGHGGGELDRAPAGQIAPGGECLRLVDRIRSEEHTSELQSREN